MPDTFGCPFWSILHPSLGSAEDARGKAQWGSSIISLVSILYKSFLEGLSLSTLGHSSCYEVLQQEPDGWGSASSFIPYSQTHHIWLHRDGSHLIILNKVTAPFLVAFLYPDHIFINNSSSKLSLNYIFWIYHFKANPTDKSFQALPVPTNIYTFCVSTLFPLFSQDAIQDSFNFTLIFFFLYISQNWLKYV